jgi:bacitracin transport system permease protein
MITLHNIVHGEFLKLKRSKMFLICLLGSLTAPIMVFIGLLKSHLENPLEIITYGDLLDQTNMYVVLLFGLVVYVVIAAYLFSREYTEHTLKSVITTPVSRAKYITGKYIMFFIWIMFLTLVAWLGTFFFGALGGASDFSWAIVSQSFSHFYAAAILLYLTLTPFVFITLWMKSLVPAIVVAAAISMGNVALFNDSLAALFPWTSAFLLGTDQLGTYGYTPTIPLVIVVVTFLAGLVASFLYFKREDVKL